MSEGVQPVLQGARLTLRPPRDEDAESYRRFGRDPEIARMYGADAGRAGPITGAEAGRWLATLKKSACGWAIDSGEGAIGAIRLHSLDIQDRRARLAVGFFARAHLGRGLGREAIRLVLAHGFAAREAGGLGLNRIDLRVLDFNERARRCYRACGFREEGRERESAFVGGGFHDDVMMGILAREFLSGQ